MKCIAIQRMVIIIKTRKRNTTKHNKTQQNATQHNAHRFLRVFPFLLSTVPRNGNYQVWSVPMDRVNKSLKIEKYELWNILNCGRVKFLNKAFMTYLGKVTLTDPTMNFTTGMYGASFSA